MLSRVRNGCSTKLIVALNGTVNDLGDFPNPACGTTVVPEPITMTLLASGSGWDGVGALAGVGRSDPRRTAPRATHPQHGAPRQRGAFICNISEIAPKLCSSSHCDLPPMRYCCLRARPIVDSRAFTRSSAGDLHMRTLRSLAIAAASGSV